MSNISRYITILVSFILFFTAGASSQQNKKEEIVIDWWQGVKVEIDAFSAVMSAVNKETYSFEGNVQVNLKEKYFPVIEVGIAGANKISSVNFSEFKTTGIFWKVGFDYNLLAVNDPAASIRKYFFIGARYGFSGFSYDISNIKITDGYWGTSEIKSQNINTYKHWLEVMGGLRVEIFKNVFMGWSVRRKILFGEGKTSEIEPWYIPGLGIKSTGKWGFNYTIGYSF